MDVYGIWILLAAVGTGLVVLFLYALCRMASEQDRAARHSEKAFFPHSEVTITGFSETR